MNEKLTDYTHTAEQYQMYQDQRKRARRTISMLLVLCMSLIIVGFFMFKEYTLGPILDFIYARDSYVGSWIGYDNCKSMRIHKTYDLYENRTFTEGEAAQGTWTLHSSKRIRFHYDNGLVTEFDVADKSDTELVLHYDERRGESCGISFEKQSE